MPPVVRALTIDDVPFLTVTLHGREALPAGRAAQARRGGRPGDRRTSSAPRRCASRARRGGSCGSSRIPRGSRTLVRLAGRAAPGARVRAGAAPRRRARRGRRAGGGRGARVRAVGGGPPARGRRGARRPADLRGGRGARDGRARARAGGGAHGLEGAARVRAGCHDRRWRSGPARTRPSSPDTVLAKVDALRGGLIPSSVDATVTRNYGETAGEKSNELIEHLLIATLSVDRAHPRRDGLALRARGARSPCR